MTTTDRRDALLTARTVNGIDFVELDPIVPGVLRAHFIFNLFDPATPETEPTLPANPGETLPLAAENFIVEGGERISAIRVTAVARPAGTFDELAVTVDQVGDFSTYTLTLTNPPGGPPGVPDGFDPQSASAPFIFHVECAKDFDCAADTTCPPDVVPAPRINYLARDYPSFLRTMLDRMALIAPGWRERNPADLGVAVVETLSYVADHLSYRQDVIATEAYLGTARLRTSARRHARLVDYHIGEGRNARAWLRVQVTSDGVVLPKLTVCATTHPGVVPPRLEHSTRGWQRAIDAGAVFFQTMSDSPALYMAHAEMALYAWSNVTYCLPIGATEATLDGHFPALTPGMVLVLAEVKGSDTGDPADADPAHRQGVALTSVRAATDPLDGAVVTEIAWAAGDALSFPLCIASRTDVPHGATPVTGVSAAWGNIVLADHGRPVGRDGDPLLAGTAEPIGVVPGAGRFRPVLAEGPVTFAAGPPAAGSASAATPGADEEPVAQLAVIDTDHPSDRWEAQNDLLGRGVDKLTREFVPEIENDGVAYLRFGDGVNGMAPPSGTKLGARYRVGNGVAGNVARDAIALIDNPPAGVAGVSNPLAAWGGVDPETIEHIRQAAPVAFRTQMRAVTPADYVRLATEVPGVRRAAATMRWTGSWTTVFVTVEREDQLGLDPGFITGLEAYLDGFRMAGVDLQIEEGVRVPLHVAMQVCVRCGYAAVDVEQALLARFGNGILSDGTPAIFHPDRLELGAPFYLSPLYAAAQATDGVASAAITRFERQDAPGGAGLAAGVLVPQALEFFVLDNDLDNPERGRFELAVGGGL